MRLLIEIWESVKMALEAIKVHKLRSLLTTLGILIGVCVVVVIISVIQGLNKYVYKEISALGSDVLYIQRFPWMITSEKEWLKVKDRRRITLKEARTVERLATLVTAVAPEVSTWRAVKYKSQKLKQVIVVGTDQDYMITVNALPEYGRFLNEIDVTHRRSVCVIGYEVAEKLFKGISPLGRRIKIGPYKFRVVGILEKRGKLFGFNLDTMVIIPIESFWKLYGPRRSVTIQVKVAHPSLLEEAKYQLTGIMRRIRRLPPKKENDFSINEQSLLSRAYKSATGTLWIVLIGVGSIALLVGGVGIMNIMLVSVSERTREIGIRKALGARRKDILWQFLIESMMVCAIGVTLGILLAIGVAGLIKAKSPLPVDISLWVVFLGIGFVVLLGTFFGIYPATKAARLDPIEAIRYE